MFKIGTSFLLNDGSFPYSEVSNLDCAFVKSCGVRRHSGFLGRASRKKQYFHQKFNYYCNTSASFQLDNILACRNVHPNRSPGMKGTRQFQRVMLDDSCPRGRNLVKFAPNRSTRTRKESVVMVGVNGIISNS